MAILELLLRLVQNFWQIANIHSPDHGYIVGARGSFAETNDGGNTWEPRSFSNLDAEEEARFGSMLSESQNVSVGNGMTVWKQAVLEHNLLATSRIYDNITFEEMGSILGTSPEQVSGLGAGAFDSSSESCWNTQQQPALEMGNPRFWYLDRPTGVWVLCRSEMDQLCLRQFSHTVWRWTNGVTANWTDWDKGMFPIRPISQTFSSQAILVISL